MGVPIPIVDKILGIVQGGIQYLMLLHKTAPIRKMKAAIEAAEKYIQVNTEFGEFAGIEEKRKKKLLKHYAKRFFHYN